ncbi:MAG: hypothetical protein KAT68_03090 [Bacteroidales bacterium]|nr:hypothetical protein [Bacteroidales bacterium]
MKHRQIYLYFLIMFFTSCNQNIDPINVVQKTISSIDTINTIYYQQTLIRGNTENTNNVIPKERAFYYERLKSDSIIGAKAHIYFYDSNYVFHEDIYDGDRLIRKHNVDSSAVIFDLIKYPDLRKKPFWGKTTPYTMQYMLKYALENIEYYILKLENDTIINGVNCYYLRTILEKKALMPGFNKITVDTNRVETMVLFIDKLNYYPQKMRLETYFFDSPDNIYFTDHHFYNIKFNPELNDSLFITSDEVVKGFKINEIKP